MKISRFLCSAAFCAALPLTARAEIDLAAVKACVARHAAEDTLPAPCVAEAMGDCLAMPADAPSLASQCFRSAHDSWSKGIAAHMAHIRDTAPEKIAAIAGIEVKYDLLAGLTQCDRAEELALLGRTPVETIQRDKDRCTAAASGIAYVRLLWRSQDLP
ncbi:hypothetical protein [Marimonas lutisalis]|uniref:hypothetical protein n=1 Tax=Marimonas lutisalis TaxID=2545756 RepID=UPI0010F8B7B3|nr:hypothetical protein [Marimonas lutisalis]